MKENMTILHTNDIHGNYDLLLRQATFIKKRVSELQAQGEKYILLDGGDHLDMSINECLATSGNMHLEMLEDIGYHAMSVGNNELLRSTPELIRSLSLKSRVPWLLLNLEEGDGSSIGGTKETLLLEVGENLKVGLFGATDQFEDVYEEKHGFRNRQTLDSIKQAINILKQQGANLIVFLSHMGYDADIELAKQLSGMVDVIVGAHTHTVLAQPVEESGVIIVQAGSHGRYVGELRLEVDITDGKVGDYEGKLTEIKQESERDLGMTSILEKGRQQTDAFLSEVLSYTNEPLPHKAIIKLMADSLRRFWSAEIGIMYGAGAASGLEAGEVTKEKILNLCKSMHSPVLIEMAGEQIVGLIHDSFRGEVTDRQVYGNGFRPHGIAMGSLEFSGMTWTDQSGTITDIKVNGESIDTNRRYTVGSGTPLLYAEVCGYASVEGCQMISIEKSKMVKDVVINNLKENHKVLN